MFVNILNEVFNILNLIFSVLVILCAFVIFISFCLFVYWNELIRLAGFKSSLVGYFWFSFSTSNLFQAAFLIFMFMFFIILFMCFVLFCFIFYFILALFQLSKKKNVNENVKILFDKLYLE